MEVSRVEILITPLWLVLGLLVFIVDVHSMLFNLSVFSSKITPILPFYLFVLSISFLRLAMASIMDILKIKPFVEVSVGQLLWGYEDPLLKLAKDVVPKEQKLPYEEFGVLYGKNSTSPVRNCLFAFSKPKRMPDLLAFRFIVFFKTPINTLALFFTHLFKLFGSSIAKLTRKMRHSISCLWI